jgi:hypothetical protein
MEVNGQLHAPVPLPRGNISQYPFNKSLDGPQSWSEIYGENKNLFLLPEIEPLFLGRQAYSHCVTRYALMYRIFWILCSSNNVLLR